METIAAIATAQSPSAIGIVRLSGEETRRVLAALFTPASGMAVEALPYRRMTYGDIRSADGTLLDRGMAVCFSAAHSYTGEESAELHCHGSPVVLSEVLQAAFAAGARQARPGEFTQRAFLNGKLDLTEAEAVIDLIDAETAESARNAAAQLSGALRRPIESVYDKLLDVSSRFYAVVDYPDEDIEDLSREETERTLLCCEETLSDLLGTFARGKVLKNGVATAIIGAPNAGKSSLLNALVGFDRAIVTDIAGTTRDTVEEKATVGGVLLRLIDTAGLHETDDLVEQLGVERSKKAVEDADLILALLDGSTGLPASEARAAEMLAPLELAAKSGKPWLLLLTKSDLGRGTGVAPDEDWRAPEAVISLSSVTHEGFEALEAAIRTLYPAPKGDTSLVTNARQADAIRRALDSVRAAKDALQSGMTPDVVLTEVEQAENALGELTGHTAREDMVARIFERFCVGNEFGLFVGTLFQRFGQHFLGRLGGADGIALRNEKIIGITGPNIHDIIGVAQFLNVFLKNYLHDGSSGFDYLNISVTNGRMAKWRARLTAVATFFWNFCEVPVRRRGRILPCSLRNFLRNSASL